MHMHAHVHVSIDFLFNSLDRHLKKKTFFDLLSPSITDFMANAHMLNGSIFAMVFSSKDKNLSFDEKTKLFEICIAYIGQ